MTTNDTKHTNQKNAHTFVCKGARRAPSAPESISLLFLSFLLFCLGCTAPLPSPTPSLPPAADTLTVTSSPTATLTPTATPAPSPTTTPTAAPSPTPTMTQTPLPAAVFAVIGDYGEAGEPARQVAELVLSWQPDFIVTTGDNNYPNGATETMDDNIGQYYHSYIFPYHGRYGPGAEVNRFFPVLGNHDWLTAGAQPYFDYFTLPGNERYYEFIWPPLHFFMLNSDPNEPDKVGRSSTQAAWLQNALAASSQPWQIVVLHHAPYASGAQGGTDWARWPFQMWGVDAVLSGHDHIYERLMLNDLPYFVNGLGGGARYALGQPDPNSVIRFRADYGAMRISATPYQVLFEFITRSGEVIDTYSLRK